MSDYWGSRMERALATDGEKLRQLTGEDHGSWVLVVCPCCDGAGEWDEGPLPARSGAAEPEYRQVICHECEGTGHAFVAAEPVRDGRFDITHDTNAGDKVSLLPCPLCESGASS